MCSPRCKRKTDKWVRLTSHKTKSADCFCSLVFVFFRAWLHSWARFILFFFLIYLFYLVDNYFTILYWVCHTPTWISHGCTCVPNPEPPSHLPPHSILLGHPSAPAPSILYPASNLDWRFVSYMILYMFQCHSPKSSPYLPTESKRLFYTSVSLLLSRIQGCHYHLSKFHIYAFIYCIGVFLSGLLHSV